MSAGFKLHTPDQIKRRVMFALELVDPVTGRLVPDLEVAAHGLGPPVRTPSGRYVWLDVDPAADRHVKVTWRSRRGVFAPDEIEFDTPAREAGQDAETLRQRHDLTPTGLYEPPPGFTAVAGAVVTSGADRTPLPGLSVKLVFASQPAAVASVSSDYKGETDTRGLFVTVAPLKTDFTHTVAAGDGLKAWLEVSGVVGGAQQTRHAVLLRQPAGHLQEDRLRANRLLRIAKPLEWDALVPGPPP